MLAWSKDPMYWDLRAFDQHGMVMCKPRDTEAAHRAEVQDRVAVRAGVTCHKCLNLLHRKEHNAQR